MSACTEPGCTGTYVDGYCDVCGSPAAATTPATPAPAAAHPDRRRARRRRAGPRPLHPARLHRHLRRRLLRRLRLTRPRAGERPRARPPPGDRRGPEHPLDDGGATGPAGAASSRTRGSSRLDSAALGSRRAASSGSVVTARVALRLGPDARRPARAPG